MRQGDRWPYWLAAFLVWAYAAFAGDSLLVFRADGDLPYLALDKKGSLRLGLDGLVDSVSTRAKAKRAAVWAFTCTGDTLEAFDSLPVPGTEPTERRFSGPCDFLGFTERFAPATPYDLMLFGDEAMLPWARLRFGERNVVAPIPSLPLRRAFSSPAPAKVSGVIRQPFLIPLLGQPLAQPGPRKRFRVVEGSVRRDNVKATTLTDAASDAESDSASGWNWSALAEVANFRLRADSRNLPSRQSSWSVSLGKNQATVVFEDSYRREPRKVAAFRGASGAPYLALETATLFGDGVMTDLWVVGADTVWKTRIGIVEGESGQMSLGTWKLDRKRGRVTAIFPGLKGVTFRAP
jgi:hypothetical protein